SRDRYQVGSGPDARDCWPQCSSVGAGCCDPGRLTTCQRAGSGRASEKLLLTELEGRLRDASFCGAGWNDAARERFLSPLAKFWCCAFLPPRRGGNRKAQGNALGILPLQGVAILNTRSNSQG